MCYDTFHFVFYHRFQEYFLAPRGHDGASQFLSLFLDSNPLISIRFSLET